MQERECMRRVERNYKGWMENAVKGARSLGRECMISRKVGSKWGGYGERREWSEQRIRDRGKDRGRKGKKEYKK